jgi:hypothetical protein
MAEGAEFLSDVTVLETGEAAHFSGLRRGW